jgi:membrane protease subunit HflK
VKVAPDYEKVIGAMQDKETTNLYALAYRAELLPLASAEAAERTNRAAAYLERTTAEATGNAARFTNQVAAYHASPAVYMLRTYLDVLGKSIASTRKYVVVPTNTHDVVTFNLEDKLRADILNELRISSPTNR